MSGIGTVKSLNDLMHERYQNPIEVTRGTVTIVGGTAGTTVGTSTIFVTGELLRATFITPDMQDSDSTNMQLVDELDINVFESGTQAESGTHTFAKGGTNLGGGGGTLDRNKVWLWGTTDVVMTAEGTQSASRNFPYLLLTQR